MAQFTPQGRLKLLFHREGVEPKDPFHLKLVSNVSVVLKRWEFNAKARLNVRDEGIYGEEDYDSEVEVNELACFRVLPPATPVNVVCWRRASVINLSIFGYVGGSHADVLEYHGQTVNSPSGSFYIPAVLRVVKRGRIRTNLSRKNVLFRDNFTSQYCSADKNLTIDHVLPAARGGKWEWENLVTACAKCNSKKSQKTLEEANMKLNKVPKAPKDFDILAIPLTSAAIRMLRKRNGSPEEWRQYLSPSTEPWHPSIQPVVHFYIW